MSTIYLYENVVDGKAVTLQYLKEDIETEWANHQNCINKIMVGVGLCNWTIRFFPCRGKKKGGGMIAVPLKLIGIESHTKSEMQIVLLHEILHWREPLTIEKDIESRSISWAEVIKEKE